MVFLGKMKKAFTVLSGSKYLTPKVLGVIRHVFGIAGTILVMLGYASAEEVTETGEKLITIATSIESLIGDFLIALALIGSWFAKEKQK